MSMLSNPQIQSTFRRWGIVIFLLVLMAILVFGIILVFDIAATSRSLEFIPISLRSNLSADYSASFFSGEIAAMDMSIIEEVISDQSLVGDNSGIDSDEIANNLLTPVPTVTPAPSHTATPQGGSASNPSATNTPLSIGTSQATATNSVTINPSSSASQLPSVTPTATSNSSPLPTNIATNTPTFAATLAPTNALTGTPSITSSPTLSLTPSITPKSTNTPRAGVCALIQVLEFNINKVKISWKIFNGTTEVFLLEELLFDWPAQNKQLSKIGLNGKTIWSIQDQSPPTYVFDKWDNPISRREITAGSTFIIEFEFDVNAKSDGYYLELNFSNDCKVFAEK